MYLSTKHASCSHRFSSVRVSTGALRGSGSSGWFRGHVLVLLVSRLVPLESERVSFPALLQLLLRLLSAVRPELLAEQRAPAGQSHAAASLHTRSCRHRHHHHHHHGRVESTREDSLCKASDGVIEKDTVVVTCSSGHVLKDYRIFCFLSATCL